MKNLLILIVVIFSSSQLIAEDIPFVIHSTRIKAPSDQYPIYKDPPADFQGNSTTKEDRFYDPGNSATMQGSSASYFNWPWFESKTTSTKTLSSEEFVKTIKTVRKSICNAVENGTVKVHFSIDASGKFLGIGASSEAGFEVSFKCSSP